MRQAFIKTLVELADKDPRVVLLTGDLGYTVLEPFMEKFPQRFFNVGVAEQNMVGVATGLAKEGFIPYVYSIATFATLRPYEFIRNGPVVHELPVRIVGVGGGFDYGPAGVTHYALEELGALRLQPGLSLIIPCDHQQARSAILETAKLKGPIYYRLGKDEKAVIPKLDGQFTLGRAQKLREGRDLALIALGSLAGNALAAAEILAHDNIQCTVLAVSSLNPAPREDLLSCLRNVPKALTIEAHYITGALGSLVCETVAEAGIHCRIQRRGIEHLPTGKVGSADYLQHEHRLSAAAIAKAAKEF